jgi:hypothetical protein
MLTAAEIEEWEADMWFSVDHHKKAIAHANYVTHPRFKKHGPYEPGSREHKFWLTHYDEAIRQSRLVRQPYEHQPQEDA